MPAIEIDDLLNLGLSEKELAIVRMNLARREEVEAFIKHRFPRMTRMQITGSRFFGNKQVSYSTDWDYAIDIPKSELGKAYDTWKMSMISDGNYDDQLINAVYRFQPNDDTQIDVQIRCEENFHKFVVTQNHIKKHYMEVLTALSREPVNKKAIRKFWDLVISSMFPCTIK